VSAANIRYYEAEKLLNPPVRSESSYRLYSEEELHRLRFIRLCRAMDMSLDEVRALLALDLRRPQDCVAAHRALNAHLGHVRARLKELRQLEKDLQGLRDACQGQVHTAVQGAEVPASACQTLVALHQQADALAAAPGKAGGKRHV
jgi:DNA-binding transcriptional MerR regulator